MTARTFDISEITDVYAHATNEPLAYALADRIVAGRTPAGAAADIIADMRGQHGLTLDDQHGRLDSSTVIDLLCEFREHSDEVDEWLCVVLDALVKLGEVEADALDEAKMWRALSEGESVDVTIGDVEVFDDGNERAEIIAACVEGATVTIETLDGVRFATVLTQAEAAEIVDAISDFAFSASDMQGEIASLALGWDI